MIVEVTVKSAKELREFLAEHYPNDDYGELIIHLSYVYGELIIHLSYV